MESINEKFSCYNNQFTGGLAIRMWYLDSGGLPLDIEDISL